jgi:hypothetical protein
MVERSDTHRNFGDGAQNRSVAGAPSLTQACFAPTPPSTMIPPPHHAV